MAQSTFTSRGVIDDRGDKRLVLEPGSLLPKSFEYTGVLGNEKTAPDRRARHLLWQLARRNAANQPAQRMIESVAGSLIVIPLLLIGWRGGIQVGLVWTGALIGIIGTAWPLLLWSERRTHRRALARLAELPFVCVACAYSLEDIQPEPDGCTVCPECGGAWRRPTMTEPRPSEEEPT